MADLENSERRLLRATYKPVDARRGVSSKRALAKRSYAASLQITRAELGRLKRANIGIPAAKAIETIVVENSPSSLLESAAIFAEVDWDSLISVGEALVKLREQDLAAFRRDSAAILNAYEQALPPGDRLMSPSTAGNPATAVPAVSRFSTALEWAARGQFKTGEARRFLDFLPQRISAPRSATLADFERLAVMRVEPGDGHGDPECRWHHWHRRRQPPA